MRFVHLNHRYFPYVGGSERYMQEVSEMLAGLGHDVRVITSDAHDLEYFWDPSRSRVAAPAHEVVQGVRVDRIPVAHAPLSSFLFQASRRGMGEASRLPLPAGAFMPVSERQPWLPGLRDAVLSGGPFDLLHVANLGIEGLGVNAVRAARRVGAPYIITSFAHLGTEDEAARRYVSMPHQRKLLQNARSVVVMTNIEASFVKSLDIDESNIHVTGVGVNPSEVTGGNPQRFRERRGLQGRLVGYVGAVAFEKGARDLVHAVQTLRARGQDIELVLAGPRLQQFDRWFEALGDSEKKGIHLLGFIDADEKRDLLAALDVLAMPSRTESFGIAFLEGWANRKPVIAARAGAVPELVRHHENGLLVEFGDHRGIADGLHTLLADSEYARALGQRGYDLTMKRYTWPAVLDRVRRAYSHALGFELPEVTHHG